MSMKDHVVRFVAHKRSLGYKYEAGERRLLSWADAAMARGERIICADTMVQWARQTSSNDEARKRLATGRLFALWLRARGRTQSGPEHGVPRPRPKTAACARSAER